MLLSSIWYKRVRESSLLPFLTSWRFLQLFLMKLRNLISSSCLIFQGVRGGEPAVSGGLHPLLPLVHGALQLAEEQRLQGGRRAEVRQHTEARQVESAPGWLLIFN